VIAPGADGMLLHTNHFLDPGLAADEADAEAGSTTRERLAMLAERAGRLAAAADPTSRAGALIDHDAGICCHPEDTGEAEPAATLATIALDLAGARVLAHPGGPCEAAGGSGWERV
jgi:isopenicillin-N N-acyltransferase-like protein